MARPLSGGGGRDKGRATKNFFKLEENVATKLEGGKALVAGPLKKNFFYGLPKW